MYAILRADLQMNAGKSASQAGHAFLEAYQSATAQAQRAYDDDGGTKIVLTVPGERELCDLFHKAKMAKLPCSMVVEQNHVMPPHFDGSPIVTAVGIGPLVRSEAKAITKGLPLLR
jgi:PTH2 family peptidyl-tRNA hydrolase